MASTGQAGAPEIDAVKAVIGGFIAAEYLDQPPTLLTVARWAKAILVKEVGTGIPESDAGEHVRAALQRLHSCGAFVMPPSSVGACSFDGSKLEPGLRAALGLPPLTTPSATRSDPSRNTGR